MSRAPLHGQHGARSVQMRQDADRHDQAEVVPAAEALDIAVHQLDAAGRRRGAQLWVRGNPLFCPAQQRGAAVDTHDA
jgi:hypothetical protein